MRATCYKTWTSWSYDADHDVCYQIGLAYCADARTDERESHGIYVPGAYVEATEGCFSEGSSSDGVSSEGD